MIETATLPLLATAAATAVLHTAIPDHWLPFVLIGRSRGWSGWYTARITALAGVLHLLVSFGLAALAMGLGRGAVLALGESIEHATGPLLVLFGLAYAAWSWRKSGHFHPGGSRLHRGESGCDGHEGNANEEHLHYHADDDMIRNDRFSGVSLAVLIGINPCVLIVPVALSAAALGPVATLGVLIAYGIPTLLLMVVLATLGVTLTGRIRIPAVARHMEMASGLLIAVLGVVLWVFPHS